MKPEVSVIIPIYRQRKYLSEALDSVFSQSFTGYELIAVNDGSPDDVAGALRPLIDSGRVRYFEQPNAGVASARNRGLAEAQGEYVAFFDDDDLWPADSLEWRVAKLKEDPAAVMVYGGVTFFSTPVPDADAGIWPGDAGPTGDVYRELLTRCWLNSPGQALFRTAAVRGIGGFDCGIWGSDDYDLYIRLAKLGPFICVPKRALFYRIHPENASKNLWRMHLSISQVRTKHLGRFPTPANWRTWLANYRFWAGVASRQLLEAAKEAHGQGERETARRMWWYALRAQPTLVKRREFLKLGLSLR